MKFGLLGAAAAVAGLSIMTPAQAVTPTSTLYSNAALLGDTASPGSTSFNANAASGPGTLSFNIDGFRTLDGEVAPYTDVFDLTVNGTNLLSLTYALGGNGSNVIFNDPNGATITGGTFGFGSGGQLQVSLPVSLLNGSNAFNFAYSPGAGSSAQSFGDEGFGISSVLLTGNAFAGGVPEPATWALMMLGVGLAGGVMRRRAQKVSYTFA